MLCRHIFEKQKSDENERAAKRMMEKPGGRRHDAFTDYHQRIQMGDEVHGYEAEAVSPCLVLCMNQDHAATLYRLPIGTSLDNASFVFVTGIRSVSG